MKVAMPHWRGRVSPVLDTAANLLLAEAVDGRAVRRAEVPLTASDPLARARQVAQFGAEVIVCGAVSWPLEMALSAAGVQVIPQVCGNVEEVLMAFLQGRLTDDAFLMPGCCGRRRRFRGRRRHGRPRFNRQGGTG